MKASVGLGLVLSVIVTAATTATTATTATASCGETSDGCIRAGILDQQLCPIPTGGDSTDIEDAHIACLCSNPNTEYWDTLAQCQCSATGEQLREYYCEGGDFPEPSATGSEAGTETETGTETGTITGSVTGTITGSVTGTAIVVATGTETGTALDISATLTVIPGGTTDLLADSVQSGSTDVASTVTESQDASNTLSETAESSGTTSGSNSGTIGSSSSSTGSTASSTRSSGSSTTSAISAISNSTGNSSVRISPNFILLAILALFT